MEASHSNVATNAILYRSATCRAAIRAANHSHWERVQWPPNELRAAQKVIALRSSGGVQMAYVRNQKAASEYLIATMARLFEAPASGAGALQRRRSLQSHRADAADHVEGLPAVRSGLRLFPKLPAAGGVQIAYLELRRVAQRVANRGPLVPYGTISPNTPDRVGLCA